MSTKKLSINKTCLFLGLALFLSALLTTVILYKLTNNISVVLCCLLFCAFTLLCVISFLVLVRHKLTAFSDFFCQTIDDMLSGNIEPLPMTDEESLFYKIEYRLGRLYELLAKRSLKAQKNTIAVLAIMLATLLFTSLFTIAISLQAAMQESNMRTIGTSAHAGIKRLSWDEYELLAADTGIKDIGYSVIIGNAVGENFNKTPTELRYADSTYADLTFNAPDTGRLPEKKNEIATSRIVLAAMGLPEEIGTQMELTFVTDTGTFTDTFGIPLGLLFGWPIGRLLLPFIVNMLTDDMRVVTTVNPVIFVVAIVFSLITVFISCRKPAALASKVSPIEALHYTEQTSTKKKQRRSKHISTLMLAKSNLGRNKKKVTIVTLSFALSIVLLNSVYTYVNSFDFDKFVADFSLTDFTVADTTVINSYAPFNTANVSQDFINQAESLSGLEDIGSVYLWTSNQPLSEHDLGRLQELAASSDDIANELGNYMVRQEHGVNVYGLDDFPAEYVRVLDGELNVEQWKAGTGVYVTPLRMMGDGSLCLYQPGDQISVQQLDGTNKVYTVLAVVDIPKALETPLQVDMGLDYIFPAGELLGNMVAADQSAMKTIFNVDDENLIAAENWLKNYTTNSDTSLDYLSKVTLRHTFNGMINMYRLVGGTLCAILALIGILNFINSMMTSILSRRKEIAMLQSVGMTGQQVKRMLIYEGIGYSALGLLCSLVLSIIGSLTVVRMMGTELSYFTWQFTLLPVFLSIIPLVLITAFVPMVCYHKMAQKTVVERLRIAE